MAVITISRQIGSLGDELAQYLASKLGCAIVNRDYAIKNLMNISSSEVIHQLEESAKYFLQKIDGSEVTYKDRLISSLNKAADSSDNLIVLGVGGCVALANRSDVINVRVISSEKNRNRRIARQYNISEEEAASIVTIGDRKHKRFVSLVYGSDLSEDCLYDVTLNTDRISVEECAEALLGMAKRQASRVTIKAQTMEDNSMDHQKATPVFKNETEAEFARVLDMYNIEWMYEPKTFPIEWDAEGNITMAFAPDFYLPRFNLYLELTTMEQKYVTKKNKKARKVMELYPGTNVRIVYKKDFMELVERFRQFGG